MLNIQNFCKLFVNLNSLKLATMGKFTPQNGQMPQIRAIHNSSVHQGPSSWRNVCASPSSMLGKYSVLIQKMFVLMFFQDFKEHSSIILQLWNKGQPECLGKCLWECETWRPQHCGLVSEQNSGNKYSYRIVDEQLPRLCGHSLSLNHLSAATFLFYFVSFPAFRSLGLGTELHRLQVQSFPT